MSPLRSLVRSRPYGDPYTEHAVTDIDRESVVSPWNMDDEMRRMIYDGASMGVKYKNILFCSYLEHIFIFFI